ncbi:MAG TPA: magnesium transporter [Chitinispirillaceae bacterium]|nr:magnesium transporter [Chitinispirillaceae bacterium]
MQYLLKALLEERIIELKSSDKESALSQLAVVIQKIPGFHSDINLLDQVHEREAMGDTYLGYGIAFPHARSSAGGGLVCVIGWSRNGIDYTDGIKANLIFLYYIPETASKAYLDEIASLAKILEKREDLRELDKFENVEEVKMRLYEWIDAMYSFPALHGESASIPVLSKLLRPEIIEMLRSKKLNELRNLISGQNAADIAELITVVEDIDRIVLYRLLPRQMADEVFSLLDIDSQNLLLENMAREETRQVISALPPDDRTALFEELPARVMQELLNLLSDKERKEALALLSYPQDSVGRLMTNRYVAVRQHWTVAKAMEHIRKVGTDSETLVMIYVTDEKGVLKDDLTLRKMILSEPQTPISELMDGHYAYLNSLQDREDAVRVFKKYDLYALPVIDSDGILLGIVTNDDILDVAEEEATEDFHKGSAIQPIGVTYLKAPLRLIYSSRIPWLVILVIVNILSGAGIARFENLISSAVALIFFLPLLIASGGNAGSQTATLVIRSMALGELKLNDYFKAVWRELLVSTVIGLSMATAVFFIAFWRSGVLVGVVTALSMSIIVILGSLIGLSLPFILRKFRMDPAAASGPLVTSVADILGVLIYLSIASIILGPVAS